MTAGYATLAWYELTETRPIIDRLWAGLAAHLAAAGVAAVPKALARPVDPHEPLARDDLTLAQICGYLAGGAGRDRVTAIATLRYAASECEGPSYRSLIAVRAASGIERIDDLAGARAVINDPLSHSGCNALRIRIATITSDRFFSSIAVSGAHVTSIEWVRAGRADVAAIDCITWALLARYRPAALDGLAVIERLPLAPSPPLVTHRDNDPERLRQGLAAFFADPATAAEREALLWGGHEILRPGIYRQLIPDQPRISSFDFETG